MQIHKYTSFFTFCLAILLVFSSCTKEESFTELETSPVQTISATDYLANNVFQDILFQYAYSNIATGETNGWVIDKDGQVRIYDLSSQNNPTLITDRTTCSKDDLLELFSQSTPNGEVIEAEELVKKFEVIRAASGGDLTENQLESEKIGTSTFYAIIRSSDRESPVVIECGLGCGNGDIDTNPNTSTYTRFILQQSGTNNRYNQSSQAVELSNWLENIHETVWN